MVFENLQIGLDVYVIQTASVDDVVSVSGVYKSSISSLVYNEVVTRESVSTVITVTLANGKHFNLSEDSLSIPGQFVEGGFTYKCYFISAVGLDFVNDSLNAEYSVYSSIFEVA